MNNLCAGLCLGSVVGVLAAIAAGCTSNPEPADPEAEPSPALPETTEHIQVAYDNPGNFADGYHGLAYEITAGLGEPLEAAGPCDVAPTEGTVVVPVNLRLVNILDRDNPPERTDTELQESLDLDEDEAVSWVTPRSIEVEPVDVQGPLVWEPDRAGEACTDELDLASHVSSQWGYREQVEITGYLAGVPEQEADRGGAGLRFDPTRSNWDNPVGHAEEFSVTF